MDSRTRLTVKHDNGGVFTDHSQDAHDFKRDTFDAVITTDDYIYVGFRKVINALYFHINTVNTIPATLSAEYFSDTGWLALEINDDTNAFTRSAFMNWARPSDAANTTIDGDELCWMRIATDTNTSTITFQAVNLLFSDDNDISQEVPAIVDACFYQSGQTSHILYHVSSKNYIMGRLRSLGYIKNDGTGNENINEWDVLDVFELRQSSTYYAISQIYFNLSDNVDDQYWAKYQEYIKKFEESFALGQLRIDTDDDGQVDAGEKRPINTVRWSR